jgi:hypothetical protein
LLAAWLALCVLGGGFLSWLSGLPFWAGVAIVGGALANGVVAEVEDRAHGGFNNPDREPK